VLISAYFTTFTSENVSLKVLKQQKKKPKRNVLRVLREFGAKPKADDFHFDDGDRGFIIFKR
jgi:hypothetical protein